MLPCEVEIILEEGVRAMRLCNRGDALSFSNADDITPQNVGAGAPELKRVLLTQRSEFNAPGDGTAASVVPANGIQPLDGQQNLNGPHNCWFRVGQQVRVSGTGAAMTGGPNYDAAGNILGVVTTITSIKLLNETHGAQADRGKIALTFADDVIAPNVGVAANIVVGLLDLNGAPLAAGGAGGRNLPGHGTFSRQIFNPRLAVQKVIPPTLRGLADFSSNQPRRMQPGRRVTHVNMDDAMPAN